MPQSDNHGYNVPNEGDPNWDEPLNENFRDFDADIEIRDTASNRSSYTPQDGAKFLATDTGVVSLGDGSSWLPSLATWRYAEPATSGSAGNYVAGHPDNGAADGVSGATIAGGGFDDGSTALPNAVTADFGVIGGGAGNESGDLATVAGGASNVASGMHAAVGGGVNNEASGTRAAVGGGQAHLASSEHATIGGGTTNEVSGTNATVGGGDTNLASGSNATVGGGYNNTASGTGSAVAGGRSNTASGADATVGGGDLNLVSGEDATVAGGNDNEAGAQSATVGGGTANAAVGLRTTVGGGTENRASGTSATVPGGSTNEASGTYSFAAGSNAVAADDGAFVWNHAVGYHDTDGDSVADSLSSASAVNGESVTGANTFTVGATGGVRFVTGASSVTYIPSGSTGWSTTSSRAAKTNVEPVDPQQVLAGVASLEVATWEYRDGDGDGAGTTHVGPMAEDFHEAFDVGDSDAHINAINADGVALAAIKGLAEMLDERDERIEALSDRLDALEAENGTSGDDGFERADNSTHQEIT